MVSRPPRNAFWVVSAIGGNPIVLQRALGPCVISFAHHQPAREYAYSALEDAHIYVHFKAVYTLALKQCLGKGNGRGIGATQQKFHGMT